MSAKVCPLYHGEGGIGAEEQGSSIIALVDRYTRDRPPHGVFPSTLAARRCSSSSASKGRVGSARLDFLVQQTLKRLPPMAIEQDGGQRTVGRDAVHGVLLDQALQVLGVDRLVLDQLGG
jgi:hypothetical protein